MNSSVFELRAAYELAEKEHRSAFRRAQWLERRLLDAPTEQDYARIKAELDAQEELLKARGRELALARYKYCAEDFTFFR